MATPSAPVLDSFDNKQGIPKSKRKLQKHLRSAGLAYISRTGKLIPAKKVADELCQCPHKCDELVPIEARYRLFHHFYGLGEADHQNQFLRTNMDLRARLNVPESTGSGRPPRRITCKYLVPLLDEGRSVEVCQKAFVSAFVITTKRVRLQREKLISSLGLNSYRSHNRGKDKDKQPTPTPEETNNNNVITLTTLTNSNNNNNNNVSSNNNNNVAVAAKPKPQLPLNLSRACADDDDGIPTTVKCKSPPPAAPRADDPMPPKKRTKRSAKDNPLIPFGLVVPEGVTIAPVFATPDHDRDIAIVNNFFHNQLWKPEYIGAYS
ncbi:myb-like protein U [Cylas formicarius]|uniref:myb-like protein U n=1 Tax=Cylas formicarius TaxID=197179 RepID=UPI0029586AB9|nr:myb-like protein U [Cylas formicarius]